MARYVDTEKLAEHKFSHITFDRYVSDGKPKSEKEIYAYKVGYNEAIDRIIQFAPPADVVDKELYDRLLENSTIIAEALNKYQTADMVEVVRCKECEYHDDEKPWMVYCFCPDRVCGWVSEDFFCGNGRKERK